MVSLELLCSETFIIEGRRMLMIVFDRSKALTHVCVCNRTCACDVFIRRAARPCCCSCFYCLTSVGVGCVCVGPVTLSSWSPDWFIFHSKAEGAWKAFVKPRDKLAPLSTDYKCSLFCFCFFMHLFFYKDFTFSPSLVDQLFPSPKAPVKNIAKQPKNLQKGCLSPYMTLLWAGLLSRLYVYSSPLQSLTGLNGWRWLDVWRRKCERNR